jgi:hypothetical protein
MTYDQARLIIKDGDIVFISTATPSLVGRIITAVTGSPFTHVCIAFWIVVGGKSRLMCVEAQGGTSRRIINLSYYSNKNIVVVIPPPSWEMACDPALSKVATVPYGWGEAAYVGLRDVASRRFNIKLPKKNLEHEICSEFVADVYSLANACVSPGDLYKELEALGCTKRQ